MLHQESAFKLLGEVPMSKVATNTNLKVPLPLKPAPPGW